MDDHQLLIDLHKQAYRQGPGGDAETERALNLALMSRTAPLEVADSFEKGVTDWRRYLKVGGLLVASEITWITDSRPSELQDHWEGEYPEIDVASAKIRVLETHGYSPIGYCVLPEYCRLDQYCRPMRARFEDFLNRNGNSEAARAIVATEQREIEMYEMYKAHVSYGVYVARKLG